MVFFYTQLCCILELEGTHRVRTHTILLLIVTLTLTFDLWTKNRITCKISQDHSLYQVWTLWDHSFRSYGLDISVKNALIDPMSFDLWTPKQYHFYRVCKVHSVYQVWTQHFEIIRFWVMLRTNRQTDWIEHLPTPTDRVTSIKRCRCFHCLW